MSRTYPFVWLDVFTTTPMEGNQLAVFPDARGLSDEEMQTIARETHLSETTFVFPEEPAADAEGGFRTRIFAVDYEMPFAGHPTLGTASVLAEQLGRTEVALRLKVGRIPVRFSERSGHRFGEMVQNDPEVGQTHDRSAVAKALGVRTDDLDPHHPIQTVSTGNPFVIVPFRKLETLSKIRPSSAAMDDYLSRSDGKYFYFLTTETVEPTARAHARMVYAGGEDPATGSAAGPAVAWMVVHGIARPGESLLIEQGLEIRRRSHIYGRADLVDGRAVNVRIGGHTAPVIEGQLRL